jgi:hypothetical protein
MAALVVLLPATFSSLAEAAPVSEFEKTSKRDPVCWHYVNAAGEEFLLRLRALSLGGTSFILSGMLAGEEGRYPIFGNAELINGRVKSNLVLNDAFPSIPASTFLSGVLFTVDLDPQTLNGVFEWLAPTLSGSDPNGPREFQAFSLRGTLTYLSRGLQCQKASAEAVGPES